MKTFRTILLLLLLGAPWLSRSGAGEPIPSFMVATEPGEAIFHRNWVEPQPDHRPGDGLGPLFNAVSCGFCHFVEGRGHLPEEGGAPVPRLVRLSVPSVSGETGAFLPEPRYGWQLQDHGAQGLRGEARISVRWETIEGRYPDGEPYALRRPHLLIQDLADGPLAPRTRTSIRMPPALRGLGLLEAVPDVAILALADPGDADGDGISGRLNYAPDLRTRGRALGRFGWKANQPSVEQQIATALQEDMGITSDLLPSHPCSPRQAPCLAASHGGRPEISRTELDQLTLYTRQLPAPARRHGEDPAVVRGEALFERIGCASCHHPRFAVDTRTIRPYTDLLLHDMGPDLADGRPDFQADGREWRTAPLWGMGLMRQVSLEIPLLHDGRARGPEEAILWHGGEAEAARESFKKLPKADRAALLRFLDSL